MVDEVWSVIHNSFALTIAHIGIILIAGWIIARTANISRLQVLIRVPIWFLLVILMLWAGTMVFGAVAITIFRPIAWTAVMPDDLLDFVEYMFFTGLELGSGAMLVGVIAWVSYATFGVLRRKLRSAEHS